MDHSAQRRPKVGIYLPFAEYMMNGQTPRWRDLLAMTQRAEALGYDAVWFSDHMLYQFDEPQPWLGGNATAGSWDCWSVLAGLAAATERIELGPLVSCTSYHNPAQLAKKASTVDEISGGRLILGLGAGHIESDFRAFGFPFDHRVSRFEEAFTIIRTLLRDGQIDFDGTYYQARDCELRPQGPRPGGPPILVGSTGQRMLRLTARHADLWNGWLVEQSRVEEVAPLQALVDAACADVERDPASLERTITIGVAPTDQHDMVVPGALSGSPEMMAKQLRAFADAGVGHIQIWFHPMTTDSIEAFAPTLDLLGRV